MAQFGTNGRVTAIEVLIRANYNDDLVKSTKASNGSGVFNGSGITGVYDILENEPVFEMKSDEPTINGKYNVDPKIISSLCGQGKEERDLFPDDEEMQTLLMEQNRRYVGISRHHIKETGSHQQGIAINTRGVFNGIAEVSIPFGCYIEARILSPAKQKTLLKNTESPRGKVTMTFMPWSPITCTDKYAIHIRNFLNNNNNYQRVYESSYTQNIRICKSMNAIFLNTLLSSMLVLETLLDLEIISLNDAIPPGYNLKRDNALDVKDQDFVLGMIQAMGLIKSSTLNEGNIMITAASKKLYFELSLQLLKKCYWDGKVTNYGFGYDKTTRTNPGVRPNTGDILKGTGFGQVLNLQCNAWKNSFMGIVDMMSADRERISGKSIKGANPGQPFMTVS